MGCGQSKIGIIYPRKSKSKSGAKRSGVDPDSDEEAEEEDLAGQGGNGGGGGGGGGGLGGANHPHAANATPAAAANANSANGEAGAAKSRQVVLAPGPLLPHTEISSSQLDFFRMLDEKIENGPDYDASSAEAQAQERARLCALLEDWILATRPRRLLVNGDVMHRIPAAAPLHPHVPMPTMAVQHGRVHVRATANYLPQPAAGYLTPYHQPIHQPLQMHHPQMPYQTHPIMHQIPMMHHQPIQQPLLVHPQYPQPGVAYVHPSLPHPQPQHGSVVQYRKSRGAYTELA